MADYRYLEAWRKPPSSAAASSPRSHVSGPSRRYDTGGYQDVLPITTPATGDQDKSTLQIRLDTPGGVTYAPDVLNPHNSAKRLFIPAKLVEGKQAEYDFAAEIQRRRQEGARGKLAASVEAETRDGPTDAQAYAASIDMLGKRPTAGAAHETAEDAQSADGKKEVTLAQQAETIPGSSSSAADHSSPYSIDDGKGHDAASLLTTGTAASARSVSSRMTAMTLAQDRDGTLPHTVSSNATVAKTRLPPSVAGDGTAQKPWQATEWSGHRALDRPSQKEKEAGITQFDDVGGYGRVPSASEVELDATTLAGGSSGRGAGAASLAPTTRTAHTIGSTSQLRPSDLFVPDPRPWRPLRYVRKVDPRQMLLLCAGTTLTAGQVAAHRLQGGGGGGGGGGDAASIRTTASSRTAAPTMASSTALTHMAARRSMLNFGKMPDYKELAGQLSQVDLSSGSGAGAGAGPGAQEERGGIGFVFCPPADPACLLTDDNNDNDDDDEEAATGRRRVEANFSRRLERPPEFSRTTKKRAALRSVLAALEYQRWEEEGFDKLVLATHHRWLIDGISRDIWEWRYNGWRLTSGPGSQPLGMPGESVPDRDLWELLDATVRSYEKIDCTVRFWYVSREENGEAVRLAERGALGEKQQPGLVRWTKAKKPIKNV